MDANLDVYALTHVQIAAIQALFESHPVPARLLDAFEFYLLRIQEEIEATDQQKGRMSVWARTFRDHIRIDEPETGG